MPSSLESEAAWLDQLAASKLIGICIIDDEGHPVQRYTDDPSLRDLLLSFQAEKVRRLEDEAPKRRYDLLKRQKLHRAE